MDQERNYGFLPRDPSPADYTFGGYTGLVENIVLPTMDWRPWFSAGAPQIGLYFDTMACVTFSAVRNCEAIFNFQIAHNMIGASNLQWLKDNGYIDENGNVNFSERYIAKLSGTTHEGNNGWAVAEAIKKYGLIPNKLWPFPDRQRTPVFVWDDYYQDIPQALLDLGAEFKKRFGFAYESLRTDADTMKKALEHSPLSVYVHAWDKPVDGVYVRSTGPINHAVENACPEWIIGDHYTDYDGDFWKPLAPDFNFYTTGYKYAITELTVSTPPAFRHNFKMNLRIGMRCDEVKYLQRAMAELGLMNKTLITGYFGTTTLGAVIAFQKKYRISPAIGFCYEKTRAKLNELFNS